MKRVRCLTVLALSLAVAPAALAQTADPNDPNATSPQQTFSPLPPEPEGLTITPFLGVGFAGNLENSPTSFGGAIGYGFNSRISAEGEVYFAPNGEQGVLETFDSSLFAMSANVLYHFTQEAFTPYATAGIGFMTADAEAESTGLVSDDTQTQLAWNWGGGIKSAFSDRFGVRADLRYFNSDELVPDHWRLYGGVVIRRIGQW